jgi:hypothetical protein
MNQILHIFKKDTRRFRIELAVSLLLQILYVAHASAEWHPNREMARAALQFLTVLLPINWWLLIGRVIQAETLVGDTQFWITRPYEWTKLLTAKLLFLFAWIGLPYLAAQFALMHMAGFDAHNYTGTAFLSLFVISGALLLPLTALATITANLSRYTLTLLGGVVALVALSFITAFLVIDNSYPTLNPLQDHISLPLEFAAALAIILLQYATRREWLARALAIAFALVLLGVAWVYRSQALIGHAYAENSPAPMQVAVDPALSIKVSAAGFIHLPLIYSGVPQGYAVSLANARYTVVAADGTTWTSPWQAAIDSQNDPITSVIRPAELTVKMDAATFNRYKNSLVTLHVTLAGDVLRSGDSVTVPYPVDAEKVPGLGICYHGKDHTVHCRDIAGQDEFATAITVPPPLHGSEEIVVPREKFWARIESDPGIRQL